MQKLIEFIFHEEVMQAFEEKCRRLYDTRLQEYIVKTDEQLDSYEDQLLEAGSLLAAEKLRFESRVRRLKVPSRIALHNHQLIKNVMFCAMFL
jgi:hypothetical protein